LKTLHRFYLVNVTRVTRMQTHLNIDNSFKHEFIIQIRGHVQSIANWVKISWQFEFGTFFRIDNRSHEGQSDDKYHFKAHELHSKKNLNMQKHK